MIKKRIIADNITASDMFLTEYLMGIYPKARYEVLYAAIIRNDIIYNAKCIDDDVFVENGDVIDFMLYAFQLGMIPDLDILYEDENFLAIEKMPGIESFDEKRNGSPNVYNIALEYLSQKGECNIEALLVPYLCYSIPKYAGGVILIAKNEYAFEFVENGLKQMNITMTYEALVAGKIISSVDEIKHYMNNKFQVFKNVRPTASMIITRYKVLKYTKKNTLIEVSPITMRKYQVNIHLAYIGYPVLGDYIFGNSKLNSKLFLDYENIWLKKLSFFVGKNSQFFYLDGLKIEMENTYYPKCFRI